MAREEKGREAKSGADARPARTPQVYTLLVEAGRRPGDDLPEDATGAAFLCYAGGITEEEAVRETVAVLTTAGLSVLAVESQGSREEIERAGGVIAPEEAALMDRALADNAVIVAQTTVFTD